MNETNETLIQYNDDETVNVPFGRVAEQYISKHPLLKNIRLKCQSRKKTPELINQNIITVGRVEGAIDYIEWKTNKGEIKSTNRIDDIVHLTPMGEEYIKEIEVGKKKDKLCWSWVMFCAGDGNQCQRECGGIGNCKENCPNHKFSDNIYFSSFECMSNTGTLTFGKAARISRINFFSSAEERTGFFE